MPLLWTTKGYGSISYASCLSKWVVFALVYSFMFQLSCCFLQHSYKEVFGPNCGYSAILRKLKWALLLHINNISCTFVACAQHLYESYKGGAWKPVHRLALLQFLNLLKFSSAAICLKLCISFLDLEVILALPFLQTSTHHVTFNKNLTSWRRLVWVSNKEKGKPHSQSLN